MISFGSAVIGHDEMLNVLSVIKSGRLTQGPWVEKFEGALAEYLGVRHVQAVSSGTAALHLALLGCGVGPGDEVIVPATTFVATANAVLYCGATPVVCDVEEDDWTLNPDLASDLVTTRTKAVIPVHLYGATADVPVLAELLRDHHAATGQRIYIVEDCAESFGAVFFDGGRAGCCKHSDAAAFSFYGSKTITTGEGGAVATNDRWIAQRVSHAYGHCQTGRYQHDGLGFNYRMPELSAAVGCAQLGRLNEFLERRAEVFAWYDDLLPEEFVRQDRIADARHGMWAYAVKHHRLRYCGDVLWTMVDDHGVECRPVFPPVCDFPHIPAQNAGCSVARELHATGIVLPTHCNLDREDVEKVCQALEKVVSS